MTLRYNRLIDRAVIDEISERLVVTCLTEPQDTETKLTAKEMKFQETGAELTRTGLRVTILPGNIEKA